MKTRIFLLALSLILSGCQAAQVAGTSVDPVMAQKAAFEARSTYALLLTGAVVYAERKRCDSLNAPLLCSRRDVVDQMRRASVAADAATGALESASRTLGGNPTVLSAAMVAAQKSVAAFRIIVDAYR